MSKSYRKTPRVGITLADSEQEDKRRSNRRFRRITRQAIYQGKEPPLLREVSNIYDFAKDGRRWIYGAWFKEERGGKWAQRMMRK